MEQHNQQNDTIAPVLSYSLTIWATLCQIERGECPHEIPQITVTHSVFQLFISSDNFFDWESFYLQGTSLASAKSGFNGAVRLINIGHYLILVFLASEIGLKLNTRWFTVIVMQLPIWRKSKCELQFVSILRRQKYLMANCSYLKRCQQRHKVSIPLPFHHRFATHPPSSPPFSLARVSWSSLYLRLPLRFCRCNPDPKRGVEQMKYNLPKPKGFFILSQWPRE